MNYRDVYQNAFGPPALTLVEGNGSYVTDENGKVYLDLLAGIAVNALGHNHPAFVSAVSRGAAMAHVSNFFTTPTQVALAERLTSLLELEGGRSGKAFLVNSGTEATEAAIKLAMLARPGGKILALTGGFHGRSLGALSVTHKPAIRTPFRQVPGCEFIEPRAESLAGIDESVAAVIVEPIQGEAGVIPLDPEFLIGLREKTEEVGALLIVDEIQTGMGRTGRWFAHTEHVQADVVTLAKGLGGGFPIGAMIATGEAAEVLTPGTHGTTFGGNPLAAGVSLAVIGEIAGLLGHVREAGKAIAARIRQTGHEVRGAGLLLGIEHPDAREFAAAALEAGIIVNAANDTTIRIAPPLNIGPDEVEPLIELLYGR